jgi:hypothetical protein
MGTSDDTRGARKAARKKSPPQTEKPRHANIRGYGRDLHPRNRKLMRSELARARGIEFEPIVMPRAEKHGGSGFWDCGPQCAPRLSRKP